MQNDRLITIAAGNSRKATYWPAQQLLWSELVDRLRTPVRGTETFAEYLRLPKARQDELKDTGGFVGGTLRNNRRKAGNVLGRDVIALDLDSIPAGGTENVLRRLSGLGCAYAVYSTRKHEPGAPRLRVLLPTDRTLTADEYEPAARKLGEIIGIELCDPTTFEASRLMYWPSCSADGQYVYAAEDKPFLAADGVLGLYADWRDMRSWPEVPGAPQLPQRLAAKQGDPKSKPGIVGAFCRLYSIYRAMDELLPGVYIPTDTPDRYTFAGGSTAGGAVVYDGGDFLYSHHATDPCSGRLVNAYDLVRLHLFGDQDDEAKPETPVNKLPSYVAMSQRAIADPAIALEMNRQRYDAALADFNIPADEADTNWISRLQLNPNTGRPERTRNNMLLVLDNDPSLRGKMAFDEFSNRGLCLGRLPWDARDFRRDWDDTDDAGLRTYLEHRYGLSGADKVTDASLLCARRNTINDVRDYLESLDWDGEPRIDTLLCDYLGAEQSEYTKHVARKFLAAAVARVMRPGIKFDYTPILVGPQGIGKSTLVRILGRQWYSESLMSFDGKEAAGMLQGFWINEIGELSGMTRSEVNTVKQFLSRTEDVFREPYGKRTGRYPRRCVFIGTTNDDEFLRDRTGDRRFWPVDCSKQTPGKSVFSDLDAEVDQIWAEAVTLWRGNEPLVLTGEAAEAVIRAQENHRTTSGREGMILEFIRREVPLDWENRSLDDRRMYWSGGFGGNVPTEPRRKICALEVWYELYRQDAARMRKQEAEEINDVIQSTREWGKRTSVRCGPYGVVKGFKRDL